MTTPVAIPAVEEQTLLLSIRVRVQVAPGTDMTEFVNDLAYDITSGTDGARVVDTEIVDSTNS